MAEISHKDCFTFSYTSGTTGNPKAAMLSHENFSAIIAGSEDSCIKVNNSDVHLSYLPLPHVFERLLVCSLLFFGASIGFFGGDMLKMKDDL
jgi:long-chain acyl-CoA synthetase